MRFALLAIFNETYKRLLIFWDYKFNLITQLVTVSLIFIGAGFLLGGGQFNSAQLAPLLVAYVAWFYARIVIMSTSADLVTEAQAGTLEQMYMSPAPASLLLFGRMFALLISTTLMVLPVAIILILLLRIQIPLRWEGLPVLLLTLAGLFGFTLILSGVGLVFKQTEALADLVQNLLLFLTGVFLPVERFPPWLATITKIFPITEGNIVLRNVMLKQQSLATAWNDGSLVFLTIHTILYIGVGLLIFKWCEHIAKQAGSLGQY